MVEHISIDGLMDVEEIAAALKLSVRHVRDRLIHEASFPRPTINRPHFRRWQKASIERWLAQEAAKSAR